MTRLLRALLLAALAACALPALAAAAPASTRGIVVQRDAATGSVVLASPNGVLHRVAVATPGHLRMGSLIQVRGSKISILGHARSAKVRGLVMRRSGHAYALAGNGAVVAVATPTPPPAGQEVTATVQVTPTELSDDDGTVQVDEAAAAPSAELHGTVLAQDASVLRLSVPGFTAGLAIALAGQTIPALAVGTPVEVRVSIGPDPANPAGIVLTLVSLHAEQGGDNGQPGAVGGSDVKAEGQVTAVSEAGPVGGALGSLTVLGEHGSVTFVIPAGFGPTGAVVGDQVEARGTAPLTSGGNPTLVKLEGAGDQQGGSSNEQGGDSSGDGSGGHGQTDGSGHDD